MFDRLENGQAPTELPFRCSDCFVKSLFSTTRVASISLSLIESVLSSSSVALNKITRLVSRQGTLDVNLGSRASHYFPKCHGVSEGPWVQSIVDFQSYRQSFTCNVRPYIRTDSPHSPLKPPCPQTGRTPPNLGCDYVQWPWLGHRHVKIGICVTKIID